MNTFVNIFFSQLKSYAQSDEDTIKSYSIKLSEDDGNSDEGYLGLFEVNGTRVTFIESRLLVSGKKFVIGLWLGVTSITFALILHIGRVSAKTANGLNKVLWELTAIVDKIVGLPQKVVSFMRKGTNTKEEGDNNKGSEDANSDPEQAIEQTEQQEDDNNEQIKEDVEMGVAISEEDGKIKQKSIKEDVEMGVIAEEDEKMEQNSVEEDPETGVVISDIRKESTTGEEVEVDFDVVIVNAQAHEEDKDTAPPNEAGLNSGRPSNATETLKSTTCDTVVLFNNTLKSTNTLMRKKRARQQLDHAFHHFTKSIQKVSTISTIAVLAFLVYNVYIYSRFARRLSFDWLILFPFPFWVIVLTLINTITFIVTESILYYKQEEERRRSKATILLKITTDFIVTMSATTVPLFIFFHLFWLFLALSAFSIRLLSSATFYLPLAVFGLWILSVTSGILKQWKKLFMQSFFGNKWQQSKCKASVYFIGAFLYALLPLLFLPFWVLLLATLHFFSDFLLEVVNLEEQNFLIVIGAIAVVTATTRKIAKHCQPQIDDDD